MFLKKTVSIEKIRLIELPKIKDCRGDLSFLESLIHIPFEIKRIYFLHNIPCGIKRGGHAHKSLEQFLIALNGGFDVFLDDGFNRKRFSLTNSNYGLYIPAMLWREVSNFSSRGICLVLASQYYDESDYIRNYEDFIKLVRN